MLYNLDLNDRAFEAIRSGTKKIEIRVTKKDSNKDYSKIQEKDKIIFTNSLGKK